jgi:hypothetical protein
MNRKQYMITASLAWYFVVSMSFTFTATAAGADGLESLGNTDGILTWHLDSLGPGDSAQETVIFAYTKSRKKLLPLLEAARRDLARQSGPLPIASDTNGSGVVWISNGVTDLALEANGSFFWEGKRQALTSERGGQLSRVHWKTYAYLNPYAS